MVVVCVESEWTGRRVEGGWGEGEASVRSSRALQPEAWVIVLRPDASNYGVLLKNDAREATRRAIPDARESDRQDQIRQNQQKSNAFGKDWV